MALQEADCGGEAIAIRFVIQTETCHVTMWRDLLQRRACSAHAQTPSASLRHEASKRHLLYVIEQGHGRSGNNRLQRERLGVNHVMPLVTATVHPRRRARSAKKKKKREKERRKEEGEGEREEVAAVIDRGGCRGGAAPPQIFRRLKKFVSERKRPNYSLAPRHRRFSVEAAGLFSCMRLNGHGRADGLSFS